MSLNPAVPKVLVVDDDRATRILISKTLRKAGFDVELASDGAEALALLPAQRYHAVLLDLIMPRVDGLGVLRQMAATDPALLRRTILITGYPEQSSRARQDVRAVLEKPLDLKEVLRLLQQPVQET